jgi:hypothetical protein
VAATIDNLALTQHHVLTVQDAGVAVVVDNVDLTQHYTLTVQDATAASTIDNVVLVLLVEDPTPLTASIRDRGHTATVGGQRDHMATVRSRGHTSTAREGG